MKRFSNVKHSFFLFLCVFVCVAMWSMCFPTSVDIIMGTNFDLKIVKPPVNDQIDAHSLLNASSVSNRCPVQIAILT